MAVAAGDDDSYYRYQQDLKERANRSLNELRRSLDDSAALNDTRMSEGGQLDESRVAGGSAGSSAAQGVNPRASGDALRRTLQSHGVHLSRGQQPSSDGSTSGPYQSTPLVPPSTHPATAAAAATAHDVITRRELDEVLGNLTSYIRQLEGENTFIREDQWSVAEELRQLREEKQQLTQQLAREQPPPRGARTLAQPTRSHSPAPSQGNRVGGGGGGTARSTLAAAPAGEAGQGMPPSGISSSSSATPGKQQQQPKSRTLANVRMSDEEVLRESAERGLLDKDTVQRWHNDISRLKTLHEAKTRRLEDQLEFTRQQLAQAEATCEELRAKLRTRAQHDRLASEGEGVEPGLCMRCAQHEAVLTATHSSLYMQKIQRLDKEKEELREMAEGLKRQCTAMQAREVESYGQVKQSLQLVEQSQLEKTQALLQLEQVREELRRSQRRLEDAVLDTSNKVQAEVGAVRAECKREIQRLNDKLKISVEEEAAAKAALEKAAHDKGELKKALEKAKTQIEDSYTNVNKVSEAMQREIADAIVERDDMKQELQAAKRAFTQKERELQQESNLLKAEVDDLRRRVTVSETNAANSREEVLQLTENIGKLEREAFQSKRARDQMDAHVRSALTKAKDREDSLRQQMHQQHLKFETVSKELEDLMGSQNSLITKLKNECKFLVDQLQSVSYKYRMDVESLEGSNSELGTMLKKRQKQVKQLEQDAVKHGRMHHRMKQQLTKMSSASSLAQNQIVHLMVRQNNLLKDRNALAEEVQFLRAEALSLLHPAGDTQHAPPYHEPLETERQVRDDILENDKTAPVS